MKRFACKSIVPDCDEVFVGAGDQSVLDQVLAHAAAHHGVVAPLLPFVELVMTHTHPFIPGQTGPHLRVITATRAPGRGNTPPVVDPGPVRITAADSVPSNVYPLRRPRVGSPAGPAHETYRHEGVLYAGTSGFLDAAVPFVRDGLTQDQPVMVAVAEPRLHALRSALGPDADQVIFADMAELGRNPARIIPAWHEFTDRHSGPGRPVRGIGEPIWAGRRPEQIAEAQLHEALLNLAVPPDLPLWLLCPYDTAALDQAVLAEAHRSHPVLVESGACRGSTRYGGTVHVDHLFAAPLPDPGAATTVITFDPHRHDHLQHILRAAATADIPLNRSVKLATVIDEITRTVPDTGHVTIRLWQENTALVCEVTDPGVVEDPMIGRRTHSRSARDCAIGIANQLSDLVQIRSHTTGGTTTRVHTHCPGRQSAST